MGILSRKPEKANWQELMDAPHVHGEKSLFWWPQEQHFGPGPQREPLPPTAENPCHRPHNNGFRQKKQAICGRRLNFHYFSPVDLSRRWAKPQDPWGAPPAAFRRWGGAPCSIERKHPPDKPGAFRRWRGAPCSVERKHPPGKPGAFRRWRAPCSVERKHPPGKPGAFRRGAVLLVASNVSIPRASWGHSGGGRCSL